MDSHSRMRLAGEDAENRALLHLSCWHETYATLLSVSFFDKQSVEKRLTMRSQILNGPYKNRL